MNLTERIRPARRPVVLAVAITVVAATLSARGRNGTAAAEDLPPAGSTHGFRCRSFTDKTGEPHGYVLFVPHNHHVRDKLPVLLFLNGDGESGTDGARQISNNFGVQVWEMRQFFPFLAVAPQRRREGSWGAGSQDTQWALEILDSVIEEFNADSNCVYVTGVSGGGGGVWNLAAAYPERFAAMVPLCSSAGGNLGRLVDARLPVWEFYNELDGADVVDFNRAMRQRLIELGGSPLVTEYYELGHDCWNRAYRSTAMYAWLSAQSRSKNAGEARFEYWPADKLAGGGWRVVSGAWWADADGVLLGRTGRKDDREWKFGDGERRGGHRFEENWSPPVRATGISDTGARDDKENRRDAHGAMLVSNVSGQNIEIHADVWLERESEARIGLAGIRDDESDATGPDRADMFISVVMPDAGTGGLVAGDGRWLARLDSSAQRTLRADAWNDVRLRLAEGRLTVRLNGWPAVDVLLDVAGQPPGEYRCVLVTPEDGSEGRWRYVRTRVLTFSREARPRATQSRDEHKTEYALRATKHEVGEKNVNNSGHVGKPTLRGILAAWQERNSRLSDGQFEWRVVRRNQSASFEVPLDARDTADDVASRTIRIAFNEKGVRLDGESAPSVGLKRRAWEAASGASGASADHAAFQAALRNRFSDVAACLPESFTGVPYRVLADSGREVHAWERAGESYPRAIVLTTGTVQQALGLDSLSEAPLYSGLVEAFRFAVCPFSSAAVQPAAERYRVLSVYPVVDGAPCVVLEERLGDDWDCRVRRLWINLSPGHEIVRCMYLLRDNLDGSQYDIEYDQDESGLWLPRTISVLRMSSLGDPLDAVTIVRRSAQAAPFSREAQPSATGAQSSDSDLLAWQAAPGTWVDDYTENKQYFVRADGSRRSIVFSENYAGLTYADLLSEGGAGRTDYGFARLRFRGALAAITRKAVTWPGIVVTLPALYFLWWGGRRGYRSWIINGSGRPKANSTGL